MRSGTSVVFLPCGDLKETEHFYHDLLCFPIVERQSGRVLVFDTGHGYWGFCRYADGRKPLSGPQGVCLSLNLASEQAVLEAFERLRHSCRVYKAPARHPDFPVFSFFLQDPDGYLVEFQRTGEAPAGCEGPSPSRIPDAMETILRRHSYRGKFKDTPVPGEDLRRILEAGLAAPSGCNRQTTSLIAVDDPSVLAALRQVIDPPVAETAPAAICVLTQRISAYRDKCFAVQDYSAAIQNMLLAIVALGYQSCWYEGHITDEDRICDKMAQILHVPDGYELCCFLPVGIAETAPTAPKKKPFGERAWFNTFPGTGPKA